MCRVEVKDFVKGSSYDQMKNKFIEEEEDDDDDNK